MSAGRAVVLVIALVTVLYIGQAVRIAVDDIRWMRSTRRRKER